MTEKIIVLDFGSQYTQLIARRVRELNVYSEIYPYNVPLDELAALAPRGLILSGGPASTYAPGAPQIDEALFSLGVPVLGICYGLQLISRLLGGTVTPDERREYGRALVSVRDGAFPLWGGIETDEPLPVWMSHGDRIDALPTGFIVAGASESAPVAAAWHPQRRIFGLQFHPEVAHTPQGQVMLANFVLGVCGCAPSWTMASFLESEITRIREQVGHAGRIVCGLSGGVDSSVAAVLAHRAIGDRLRCIFVDNGVLRQGEAAQVAHLFGDQFRLPLTVVDARERFLHRLHGVTDPEQKRKVIGDEFIRVFDEQAERFDPPAQFLLQGTLYPDVIESVSFKGPSAVIKSHHNVGGLPAQMKLRLIEPLRELFKDEVRRLGEQLAMPHDLIWRQPFPGPGLAVRVVGEVTEDRLRLLRQAEAIIDEEVRAAGLYESIWQSFGVLLPVKSVGVMGDSRTYESVLALRAIHSVDGMTADWVRLPYELLATISSRVINEVSGINRVVYDISSKPPATIEWE